VKNTYRTAASILALTLAVGACASQRAPSPRLLSVEASLQRAKAEGPTMEVGRSAVEKAELAVIAARESERRGRADAFTHSVRMAEGYLDLARTRGQQREANTRVETLKTERAEAVSQSGRGKVLEAEAATRVAQERADRFSREASRAETATAISESSRQATQAKLDSARADLASFEQTRTALGTTLVLRDLQFSTGSATLSGGAQGRLAPLAAFLSKQPDARIQIVGHTDSVGRENDNQGLSARRAEAVGSYLMTTGVSGYRITSIGMGETVPMSSNTTAAGRAINRRVEVTILD